MTATFTNTKTDLAVSPALEVTPEMAHQMECAADEMVASSAGADKNMQKIAKGGASAKFEPRAWSYGGQVD